MFMPISLKQASCTHVVGILIRSKLVDSPIEARNIYYWREKENEVPLKSETCTSCATAVLINIFSDSLFDYVAYTLFAVRSHYLQLCVCFSV